MAVGRLCGKLLFFWEGAGFTCGCVTQSAVKALYNLVLIWSVRRSVARLSVSFIVSQVAADQLPGPQGQC